MLDRFHVLGAELCEDLIDLSRDGSIALMLRDTLENRCNVSTASQSQAFRRAVEIPVPEVTIQEGPASPLPPSSASLEFDRPSDPELRRRALARKLVGSSLPPTNTLSTPPVDAATIREKAADDLRRHRAERLAQAQHAQVRRYLDAAEAALATGNAVYSVRQF